MTESLKIGMLSWESLHAIQVGGLAQAVTGMAEGLVRNGQEVHIFTRSGLDQPDYDEIEGVHYHRCKFDPGVGIFDLSRNMCQAMGQKVREVEESIGKFDIIHGHDWLIVDALDRLQGHHTVMSFHSTEYGRNGGISNPGWDPGEIARKEWFGGYVADKVITVSQVMKEELENLYQIPSWKISVIPNGSNVKGCEKVVDSNEVKMRYGIHSQDPVVTFLGRLEYQKGPDILIEAIPQILNYEGGAKFIIGGDGGMRGYTEWMTDYIGISDSTNILGYVPEEEKAEILNASDIVCIPSRNEPFGLVLFEAWGAGDAVVASNVGGLSENIDNFINGIKIPTNPDSIAWGINYVIDDSHLSQWMGYNGRKKLKEFTWERVAKRLLKVYKK